jgi:hypothetical protein
MSKYSRVKLVTKSILMIGLCASEPAKVPVTMQYLDDTLHGNPARLLNIYQFSVTKIDKDIFKKYTYIYPSQKKKEDNDKIHFPKLALYSFSFLQ